MNKIYKAGLKFIVLYEDVEHRIMYSIITRPSWMFT